jgi:carbonic anhydrase
VTGGLDGVDRGPRQVGPQRPQLALEHVEESRAAVGGIEPQDRPELGRDGRSLSTKPRDSSARVCSPAAAATRSCIRSGVGGSQEDVVDDLLAYNRNFAAGHEQHHLDIRPSRRLAVVTCMDSRIDVFAALGLGPGEAHVLRNAGGVITDDAIRSLAISQRQLGTEEIMLIHHTDCGLQSITDDGFRAELQESTGMAPSFAIESYTDVDANVRQSIVRVQTSPFLLHRDRVRGFVYDVDTGLLREVVSL